MNPSIIPYQAHHKADFRRINETWISRHFQMEEEDFKALDHPDEKILKPGGAILLAELDGAIVGTVALIKMEDDLYELAKMGVDEAARGQGIGYMLGEAAIEKARELGARRIYLETNSKLGPALKLYQKLGFRDAEGFHSPYSRCNVQLVLQL